MMSTRLIVDDSSQLQEMEDYPLAVRISAKVISYIFHPVFVPVYLVCFLLYVQHDIFSGFADFEKVKVLLQALVSYLMFPIITVLLLKALGFISSIYLSTRKDRIIPYIACNIWYFWIWNVWKNLPGYPKEVVVLSMAVFFASVIGFLANIYMKISMHAIAMGVLVSYLVYLAFIQSAIPVMYISLGVLIAGLVTTARFIASDHTRKEIYSGLFVGVIALLISSSFV